jgi:hypothetical protein
MHQAEFVRDRGIDERVDEVDDVDDIVQPKLRADI